MFKPKLFGNNIEPRCEYCEHGSMSSDNSVILCQKRGIVPPDFSCRRFIYDPLQRTPTTLPPLAKFDASDFEL